MSSKSALIILTSASDLFGHATGYWLEEVATPYYILTEAGYEVEIASVKGGEPPIDAGSTSESFMTPDGTKFMGDEKTSQMLKETKSVAEVSASGKSYDIVFCSGGHGTCIDFPTSRELKQFLEATYTSGKVLASVCHGPNALVSLTDSDYVPLVKGKNVTGFTEAEEKLVGLENTVPFFLDAKLRELGGNVTSKEPWTSYAVADGKLVTGQNPQSSAECAKLAVEAASQ